MSAWLYRWLIVLFEELAKAVEKLTIPVDGFALVRALALRDRLDARIAEAAGDFDAAKLWDIDAAHLPDRLAAQLLGTRAAEG